MGSAARVGRQGGKGCQPSLQTRDTAHQAATVAPQAGWALRCVCYTKAQRACQLASPLARRPGGSGPLGPWARCLAFPPCACACSLSPPFAPQLRLGGCRHNCGGHPAPGAWAPSPQAAHPAGPKDRGAVLSGWKTPGVGEGHRSRESWPQACSRLASWHTGPAGRPACADMPSCSPSRPGSAGQ